MLPGQVRITFPRVQQVDPSDVDPQRGSAWLEEVVEVGSWEVGFCLEASLSVIVI